jgi:hypothetical protein
MRAAGAPKADRGERGHSGEVSGQVVRELCHSGTAREPAGARIAGAGTADAENLRAGVSGARSAGIAVGGIGTGTGKTHLAVAVLRGLIARGYDGVFFDYQELFEKIRSGYDPNSGSSDREAYRTALEAEILLLDDLGAHRYKEWVEDTITSIITYRYNNNKPLIATTNLPDDERVPDFKTGDSVVYKKTTG